MPSKEDFIKRQLYGSKISTNSASSRAVSLSSRMTAPKPGKIRHGKKVVYVTSYFNSAEEEEKKWKEKGYKTEIKKEKDDTGKLVFVVYIFE